MDIDLPILIIRDSAIESTRAEAEEIMAEDMTVNMAVNMDSTERGTEAGAGPMSSSEALTTVDNGSNQSHIEIDDIEVDASDDGNSIAKENTEVQGTSQPLEDEGYISADENSWSPETCPEHLSVRQPQMQQVVRSAIFEPLDSLEHSEIARPPLLALLTASAHSLPLPPPPHRQSDGNGKLSSFPSLQTFDEIPGLRRQSLSGAETKRLVTISAEAASRAHHHWLRPCAACARKAGAESKGWHLLQKKKKKKTGNDTRGEISIEGRQELGVYSRTVHWVKKQEERIKQL
ncbi:hypothetical protein MMC18_002141 [Xylographa bjoerkii]|nr:hypothetical protein [Xylographa bjoerkii]